MFLKPFRVKSNVVCKGAEKKKLRRNIGAIYSVLSDDDVDSLLPMKIPLFTIRLITYGGVVVTTYHTSGEPVFFDHAEVPCPSVYTLWRHPEMLRPVLIGHQTLSRLQNGADLMLSGVVDDAMGGYSLVGFKLGEYCAIQIQGQGTFYGVGMCLMSWEQMISNGMRGKAFRVLHLHGDLLWEMGSMSTPVESDFTPGRKALTIPSTTNSSSSVPTYSSAVSSTRTVTSSSTSSTVPPLDDKTSYELFKAATLAALKSPAKEDGDRRAAIIRALDERSKFMHSVPPPRTRKVMKNRLRYGRGALDSLSRNPEISLYREAQRLLDDTDDDIDEVGVTLPEKYQSDVPKDLVKACDYYHEVKEGMEGPRVKLRSLPAIEDDDDDEDDYHYDDDDDDDDDDEEEEMEEDEEDDKDEKELKAFQELLKSRDFDDIKAGDKFLENFLPTMKKLESECVKEGLDPTGVEFTTRVAVKAAEFALDELSLEMAMRKKSGEIGISLPGKYQPSNSSKDKEAANKEGEEVTDEDEEASDGEEEEEEESNNSSCGEKQDEAKARSWYSIPKQRNTSHNVGDESTIDMDELLKECFFASLKSMVPKKVLEELPLLTSTFYRLYMVEACPPDLKLDVKKSSFKKLSKFLKTMQDHGILKLKENEKGSEVITAIDFKHPLIRRHAFRILSGNAEKEVVQDKEVKPLQINTLYMPSHRLVTFFRQLGFTKASLLDYQQVRESVMQYVKENQLVDSENPKQVLPDLLLGDALNHRGAEANKGILRQELMKMIFEEMKPAYSITYGNSTPIIRRGKLEPVKLSLVQRMGNKKVTLVDNLEFYGIPANDVAQSLQKIAAASTTVNDVPGRPTARQVLVQGNAIKVVAKLLQDTYGLSVKHIEAIDKIKPSKTQKKRKRK